MYIILLSYVIDDEQILKGKTSYTMDLLSTTVKNILYSMFFETAEGYLFGTLCFKGEETSYSAELDTNFYNKHIGKFIKEVQRKIMNDILVKFVTEVEKIDWSKVSDD